MQRDTFTELWNMAIRFPESSVKRITHEEYFDEERTADDFWYQSFVPDVWLPITQAFVSQLMCDIVPSSLKR